MDSKDIILYTSLFLFIVSISYILLKFYFRQNIYEHNTQIKEEGRGMYVIPKIIWSYWDSENIPELIKKCISTWYKENPHYKVLLLDENNYREYISINLDHKVKPITRFTDFLRFQLLAEHGGIWLDASIICTQSLDFITNPTEFEFNGYFMPNFTTNNECPVIENWFLAASKDSTFMNEWNKEVQRIRHFSSVEDYIHSLRNAGVDLQNIPYPDYLMCHAAVVKVLQQHKAHKKKYNINVKSCVGDDGPFHYLNSNDWDIETGLKSLCMGTTNQTPIIKLRGCERKKMEESKIDLNCLFHK